MRSGGGGSQDNGSCCIIREGQLVVWRGASSEGARSAEKGWDTAVLRGHRKQPGRYSGKQFLCHWQ